MGSKSNKKSIIVEQLSRNHEVHWKFNQLLNDNGLSYYKLHQLDPQKFSMGTMSRWSSSVPQRPDLKIMIDVLDTLGERLERKVSLDELIEIVQVEQDQVINVQ